MCAGVDRAIRIVIAALKKYGAPVYVRHEIVHNRYVVLLLFFLPMVFQDMCWKRPRTEIYSILMQHVL